MIFAPYEVVPFNCEDWSLYRVLTDDFMNLKDWLDYYYHHVQFQPEYSWID